VRGNDKRDDQEGPLVEVEQGKEGALSCILKKRGERQDTGVVSVQRQNEGVVTEISRNRSEGA